MRRIDLRVHVDDVDSAYDRLLPHVRGGLHPVLDGDHVVLVALGERAELPSVSRLAMLAGDLLIGSAVQRDVGDDLGAALAELLPSWEIAGRVVLRTPAQPPPAPGLIDVVLAREPGFGSGAHPTTRHCIELLLAIEPGGGFADLGCGGGALTIVAFKLGYAPVAGIDLDQAACNTAARNGAVNGIEGDFITADLTVVERVEARVATMNVSDLDVHRHLATVPMPEIEWLIVSGLNDPEQLADAIATYAQAGFVERRRIDGHAWPAVLLAAPARG